MNQLFIICGLLLGQEAATPQEEADPYVSNQELTSIQLANTQENSAETLLQNTYFVNFDSNEPNELDLNSIVFIEEEEVVDLGFDPKLYLPENFNPYASYFDIHTIEYVEETPEITFDFDTAAYLPDNFNAAEYYFDIHSITFIDDEEEIIDLGYDVSAYLPRGFNPHEAYFDIHSIEYLEEEDEEVALGFDSKKYLPKDFNPYRKATNL